jgi:MFS family permease
LPELNVFRALRHRNFKLFFAGQCISMVGTWMQVTALSWLVYRLTDSAFLLGFVGFIGQIPSLLLTPFTGVVADRYNRHRIIIITQSLAMLQALVLAGLVLSGQIQVWQIVLLSMVLGLINAQDMPARQSFMMEMVEGREDLSNAIALNSSLVNAGRLLGPATGGILIAAVGEGLCFLINGLSFLAVIGALLAMRLPPRLAVASRRNILQELSEGFGYAFGFSPI